MEIRRLFAERQRDCQSGEITLRAQKCLCEAWQLSDAAAFGQGRAERCAYQGRPIALDWVKKSISSSGIVTRET